MTTGPQPLLRLLNILYTENIKQRELAKETGIHESRISMGIRGRLIFNFVERSKISEFLGVRQSDLFK